MAKSTVKFDFTRLNKIIPNVRKEFNKPTSLFKIKAIILKQILTGVSPVRGKKFQKYSDSYKKAIKKGKYSKEGKKVSPRNLKLSGDMLKTLDVKATIKDIIIKFTHELAEVHNKLGTRYGKVRRRLLPTESGEKFNTKIDSVIKDQLEIAVKKTVAKLK